MQVLNERHKLSNLLEAKGLPEIEEIHKEMARVKSELKVRTKLNRLQSAKVILDISIEPPPSPFVCLSFQTHS